MADLIRTCAIVFLVVLAWPHSAFGWNPFIRENRNVKKGNKLMSEGKPGEALKKYGAALGDSYENAFIHFNKGVAHYRAAQKDEAKRADQLKEAAKSLTGAIDLAGEEETELKGKAFYNLGNVYFLGGRWKEAAEAYRQALKIMPGDKDAAYNLSVVLKKIEEEKRKQAEEEKKQQEDREKEEEQEKPEKQEEQQQPEEEKQEEEKKEKEQCDQGKKEGEEKEQQEEEKQKQGEQKQQQQKQQEKQQQKQQEKEQQKEEKPVPLTRQQAEAILDALQRGEKNFHLENLRSLGQRKAKVLKDW